MKKIYQIILIFLIIGITNINAQTNQIGIISKVANAELSDYLNKIPVGQENMFGFNNRGEFFQAEIGIPYEVFTLNTEFFDTKNIIRTKTYIVSTENWRVPIIVNNQHRALLTVSKVNNQWSVVKIGAKGLAEELDMFNKNHPSIDESNILRVFQLKGDFILTSQNIIYPLTSAKQLLSVEGDNDVSYSLHDMLILVKNKIIRN